MDIFRVFDCLNYMPNLLVGIEAVGNAGKYFRRLYSSRDYGIKKMLILFIQLEKNTFCQTALSVI